LSKKFRKGGKFLASRLNHICHLKTGRGLSVFKNSTVLHLDLDLDFDGISQTDSNNLANGLTNTSTEKSSSSLFRQMRQNLLEIRLEAKVQETIGFIED
jgi:hypothetical protein